MSHCHKYHFHVSFSIKCVLLVTYFNKVYRGVRVHKKGFQSRSKQKVSDYHDIVVCSPQMSLTSICIDLTWYSCIIVGVVPSPSSNVQVYNTVYSGRADGMRAVLQESHTPHTQDRSVWRTESSLPARLCLACCADRGSRERRDTGAPRTLSSTPARPR
jgi:hypothetical protein